MSALAGFCIFWAALMLTLSWVLRVKRRPGARHERGRSEEHNRAVVMLRDWLNIDEIRETAIEHGTVTRNGVHMMRMALRDDSCSYPLVRAMIAQLLQDRVVRRMVADRLVRLNGGRPSARKAAMRLLLKMAEEVR